MIFFIIIAFVVFYIASAVGCISYFVKHDIEPNMLSILILLCPILNTIFALKDTKPKETIQKLRGGEK